MKNGFAAIGIASLVIFGVFFSSISIETRHAKGSSISGSIGADTIWTLAGSPYSITGDVTIESGVNLTIEPGVEVRFDEDYGLFVEGNLSAIGTEANKIKMTTNLAFPILPGNWNRIQINPSGHMNIQYSDVMYAEYGIYLNASSNNTIMNSNITMMLRSNIHLLSSSDNIIKNNAISIANERGISLSQSSRNSIVNNTILYTPFGIYVDSGSNNSIANNSILDIDYGVILSSTNNTLNNNTFVKNGHSILITLSDNRIFHNNLIVDNPSCGSGSQGNLWNESYPLGGNFWSSYSPTCRDLYSGTMTPQTTGSPDGICDMQFNASYDSSYEAIDIDYYPLKNPVESRVLQEDAIRPIAHADYLRDGYYADLEGWRSTDNVGIANYSWSVTKNGNLIAAVYNSTFVLILNETGEYNATLTVRDYAGNTDTASVTITVKSLEENYSKLNYLCIAILALAILIAVAFLSYWKSKSSSGDEASKEEARFEEKASIEEEGKKEAKDQSKNNDKS